jgi:hypothetical protein
MVGFIVLAPFIALPYALYFALYIGFIMALVIKMSVVHKQWREEYEAGNKWRSDSFSTASPDEEAPQRGEGQPQDRYAQVELHVLYRLAAKSTHPDTGRDEEERVVRTRVMAELNRAYQKKDREQIIKILRATAPIRR